MCCRVSNEGIKINNMFNFLKINNKEAFIKQITIRLVIFVAIVVIGIIFLVVLGRGIKNKVLGIQDLRRQIEELNLAGEAFSTLAKQHQLIGPYTDDLNNALPTKDKLIEFSKEVFNLASSLNIDLNFLFKGEESINDLSAIGFSITFNRVELSGLVSFLQAFKKSHYFVDINSFDISKISGTKNFSATINGLVFIKREKE